MNSGCVYEGISREEAGPSCRSLAIWLLLFALGPFHIPFLCILVSVPLHNDCPTTRAYPFDTISQLESCSLVLSLLCMSYRSERRNQRSRTVCEDLTMWNCWMGRIWKTFDMCLGESIECCNQNLIVDFGDISEKRKAEKNSNITINFLSHKGGECLLQVWYPDYWIYFKEFLNKILTILNMIFK